MDKKTMIRTHRRAARLTQVELAQLAGLKGNTIYTVEAGLRNISDPALREVARVLREHGHPFPPEIEAFVGLEPAEPANV